MGIKKKEFVYFGICKGYRVETLKSEGRTRVKSIRLYTVDDIDEVIIKEILKEA